MWKRFSASVEKLTMPPFIARHLVDGSLLDCSDESSNVSAEARFTKVACITSTKTGGDDKLHYDVAHIPIDPQTGVERLDFSYLVCWKSSTQKWSGLGKQTAMWDYNDASDNRRRHVAMNLVAPYDADSKETREAIANCKATLAKIQVRFETDAEAHERFWNSQKDEYVYQYETRVLALRALLAVVQAKHCVTNIEALGHLKVIIDAPLHTCTKAAFRTLLKSIEWLTELATHAERGEASTSVDASLLTIVSVPSVGITSPAAKKRRAIEREFITPPRKQRLQKSVAAPGAPKKSKAGGVVTPNAPYFPPLPGAFTLARRALDTTPSPPAATIITAAAPAVIDLDE